MEQILIVLFEHPMMTGFLVLCFLGFVELTYEFILRLFGKRSMIGGSDDDKESVLVKKPDDPDGTLERAVDKPPSKKEYVYDPTLNAAWDMTPDNWDSVEPGWDESPEIANNYWEKDGNNDSDE